MGDEDLVPLLLNERRPLSETARRELLPHWFSYYTDDLTILTWDNALVVEPSRGDTDVQYILEFANAQLLELRVYDGLLDAELPAMYDRVAFARPRRLALMQRRFAGLLADLQALVADSTELVERVDSALKVTDDVYLARIYTAALDIFRGREWRAGIDRKRAIIRETYAMLNAESQAARAEALEVLIVALINGRAPPGGVSPVTFRGRAAARASGDRRAGRHRLAAGARECGVSGRALWWASSCSRCRRAVTCRPRGPMARSVV